MKYDTKFIGLITTFENLTKTKVKDAFSDKNNNLVFIVEEGDGGKAIGKMGNTVRRIASIMKRRIKIIEFNSNVLQFVKNIIDPLKDVTMTQEDSMITIHSRDMHTKAALVGRNRSNINEINETVKKFFKNEVRVG